MIAALIPAITLSRKHVKSRLLLRVRPLLGMLALVLASQPAWCAASGSSMSARLAALEPQPDGGFLVDAPGYRARVGADGNLHSFQIGDTELLDDRVAISLGAFLFAEAPIKLDTVTQRASTLVQAETKEYLVQYRFLRQEIRIVLANRGAKPVAYFAVLSPDITIASNLHTKEEAAAPGEAKWADVRFSAANGAYVELLGGSRVWPWLGRQVWEITKVGPGKSAEVRLRGGVGRPPNPTLEHLLTLRAQTSPPDALVPAETPLEVQVSVDNRDDRELFGMLSMQLSGCRSELLQTAAETIRLPPKQATTASFKLTVGTPDFYTARLALTIAGRDVATATTAAGYRVTEITRSSAPPPDFHAFWEQVVAEAGAQPPLYKLARDSKRSRAGVATWVVEYQGLGGKPIYGWYLCPEGPNPHPGVLYLSGYGARPVDPPVSLASRGYVVLAIDVRGNRVDVPRPRAFEDYSTLGIDSPKTYVYREIVGHCLRGLRLLASREEVDGDRIAVVGVSEGGGVGLMLSVLSPEVKAVAADAPLLCDLPLSLEAGGWPYSEIARYLRAHPEQAAQARATLSYFDVVNFAPQVPRPVLISVGLLDRVSLPAAVFGVYNLIPSPKEIKPLPGVGHEGGGQKLWAYKLGWLEKALAQLPQPASPAGGGGE